MQRVRQINAKKSAYISFLALFIWQIMRWARVFSFSPCNTSYKWGKDAFKLAICLSICVYCHILVFIHHSPCQFLCLFPPKNKERWEVLSLEEESTGVRKAVWKSKLQVFNLAEFGGWGICEGRWGFVSFSADSMCFTVGVKSLVPCPLFSEVESKDVEVGSLLPSQTCNRHLCFYQP